MKPRFLLWTFRRGSMLAVGLVAALLAVACASSATTESAPPESSQAAQGQAPAATLTPALTEAAASAVPAVLPVATSRGPNLEATDPSKVSLASGGLQLVEFFRFT